MDSLFEGEEPPLEKVRAVSSDMTVHYRALSASSDKMRRSGDGNDDSSAMKTDISTTTRMTTLAQPERTVDRQCAP